MPLPIQAKLLQVLQDRQFSRLGSRADIRVDVRVLAATNKNLAQLVAAQGVPRGSLLPAERDQSPRARPALPPRGDSPAHRAVPRALRRGVRPAGAAAVRGHPRALHELSVAGQRPRAGERHHADRGPRCGGLGGRRADGAAARAWFPPGPAGPLAGAGARVTPTPVEAGHAPCWTRRAWRREGSRPSSSARPRSPSGPSCDRALGRTHWRRVEAARQLKISYRTLLRKIEEHGLNGRH